MDIDTENNLKEIRCEIVGCLCLAWIGPRGGAG